MNSNAAPDESKRAPRCAHCGSECLSGAVHDEESKRDFCCRGCRFVFRSLHDLGLEQFYRFLDRDSAGPVEFAESNFDYFDHEAFCSRYVSLRGSDSAEVTFSVPSMHCAACLWVIERLPRLVDGVTRATVQLGQGTVTITYNPERVALSEVARTLSQLGYTPYPLRSDQASAHRQKARKQMLLKLGVAGFAAGNSMLLSVSLYQGYFTGMEEGYRNFFHIVSFLLTLPCVFYSGLPFYRGALAGLLAGRPHVDMPISLGVLASFLLSSYAMFTGAEYVYFESVNTLVFFLLIGRFVQQESLSGLQNKLRGVLSFLPLNVSRRTPDSGVEQIPLEALEPGDFLVLHPEERLAADGVIVEGETHLDVAVLTGESRPVAATQGDPVHAGSLNLEREVTVQVESVGDASRIGRLLSELRGVPSQATSLTERIDSISAYFVLIVIALGGIGFLLWLPSGLPQASQIVVAVFVVSCPCALALGPPLIFSGALSRALEKGVFVKTMKLFELSSSPKTFLFDKTGTLTSGKPEVRSVTFLEESLTEDESERLLDAVTVLESTAPHHPLARAILAYVDRCPAAAAQSLFSEISYLAGRGLEATSVDGETWRLGKRDWACQRDREQLSTACTLVSLAREGRELVRFELEDSLAEGVKPFVSALREEGHRIGVLSGDREAAVRRLAAELGVSPGLIYSERLPEEKAEIVRETDGEVIFVGDGANDAAAIRASDLGIGMRSGAEACLENADIFVSRGGVATLAELWKFSKRVRAQLRRNFAVALLYNVVGISLALTGYVTPLVAAILMSLSSLGVLLSSASLTLFSERSL